MNGYRDMLEKEVTELKAHIEMVKMNVRVGMELLDPKQLIQSEDELEMKIEELGAMS